MRIDDGVRYWPDLSVWLICFFWLVVLYVVRWCRECGALRYARDSARLHRQRAVKRRGHSVTGKQDSLYAARESREIVCQETEPGYAKEGLRLGWSVVS